MSPTRSPITSCLTLGSFNLGRSPEASRCSTRFDGCVSLAFSDESGGAHAELWVKLKESSQSLILLLELHSLPSAVLFHPPCTRRRFWLERPLVVERHSVRLRRRLRFGLQASTLRLRGGRRCLEQSRRSLVGVMLASGVVDLRRRKKGSARSTVRPLQGEERRVTHNSVLLDCVGPEPLFLLVRELALERLLADGTWPGGHFRVGGLDDRLLHEFRSEGGRQGRLLDRRRRRGSCRCGWDEVDWERLIVDPVL